MEPKYRRERPAVPESVRRKVLVEAGHRCTVAGCEEHSYLELHHINGNREDNRFSNLIILCVKHHSMAESGDLDRLSLREYKLIRARQLGFDTVANLPDTIRNQYLGHLSAWLASELTRMETSPVCPNATRAHITPYLSLDHRLIAELDSDEAAFAALDNLLNSHGRLLLMGNGGSGKTVTLLGWAEYRCKLACGDNTEPLPVLISLRSLVRGESISALIRSCLGKHQVTLSAESVDKLMQQGSLLILFDGLNEIPERSVEDGALERIANFMDTYPTCQFVISSRYTSLSSRLHMPKVDMARWSRSHIQDYLRSRLGTILGQRIFSKLGDDVDFEWRTNCSVAGLCTNPLTLWMIASVAEERQSLPNTDDDIISALVSLMVKRRTEMEHIQMPEEVLTRILQAFAYYMLDNGYVLAIPYNEALQICLQVLSNLQTKELLPRNMDAYGLLAKILATGLLRQTDSQEVEWVHQILQESLSITFSQERFARLKKLQDALLCPHCGYRPSDWVRNGNKVLCECYCDTDDLHTYEAMLPPVPREYILQDEIIFIDSTGAPQDPKSIVVSNAVWDEGWTRISVDIMRSYLAALYYAQHPPEPGQPISRSTFEEMCGSLVDWEIWGLAEAGALAITHKDGVDVVHVYEPPTNPHERLYGYELLVHRALSLDELEIDEEEWFQFSHDEKECCIEDCEQTDTSEYHRYHFTSDDKAKVFDLACRYGGRVIRTWGPYSEILAEFDNGFDNN